MAGTNAAVSNRTGTIYYGVADSTTVLDDTADTWNETVTAGVTLSTTTADGPTSSDPISPPKSTVVVRAACSAVASGAVIMSEVIPSTDLSARSAVTFYFRTSVALAAGDIRFLLDNATVLGDGTDKETLSLPAITALNKWHRISIRLSNPSQDTAIISIGIDFKTGVTKNGNFDVYTPRHVKEIEGMKNFSISYAQENQDATDYQSGDTREFVKTFKNWTASFAGNKEGAPQLEMGSDYVLIFQEAETVGQNWIGDGFLSSLNPSGSFDALIEYPFEIQGTGAIQAPVA